MTSDIAENRRAPVPRARPLTRPSPNSCWRWRRRAASPSAWPSSTGPASARTRRPPVRPERGDAGGARRPRGARPLARRLRHEGGRDRRRRRACGGLRPRAGAGARTAAGARSAGPAAGGAALGRRRPRPRLARFPRARVGDMGARPAIPPKRNEERVACPAWIYGNRRLVENLWARLKEWRAVATRYEKTARAFLGVLCLAGPGLAQASPDLAVRARRMVPTSTPEAARATEVRAGLIRLISSTRPACGAAPRSRSAGRPPRSGRR